MSGDLGIVIPAFRPDIERLEAYVRAIDERISPAVLRIELDAPLGGVAAALSELPASLHVADRRRGKGAAITAGFETLETDVLAFVDADGSTAVDSIRDVVSPIADGTADLSVGSRRHPDGTVVVHQGIVRRRLGDSFAEIARSLLDVQLYDYQCGAKAMSADCWAVVREHLYEPGFAWDVEVVAVAGASNRRIVEVPVVWTDHPSSTVEPLPDAFRMLRGLIRARSLERSIRRGRPGWVLRRVDRRRPLIEREQPMGRAES